MLLNVVKVKAKEQHRLTSRSDTALSPQAPARSLEHDMLIGTSSIIQVGRNRRTMILFVNFVTLMSRLPQFSVDSSESTLLCSSRESPSIAFHWLIAEQM